MHVLHKYRKPELQEALLEPRHMLAESDDLTGSDMPIDDTNLPFDGLI
ncbi:MAG: hypothetical protein IK031_07160 [Bacteroidales bacterium]|nr:hypothetical protein [Bacteroidales bacterium]